MEHKVLYNENICIVNIKSKLDEELSAKQNKYKFDPTISCHVSQRTVVKHGIYAKPMEQTNK